MAVIAFVGRVWHLEYRVIKTTPFAMSFACPNAKSPKQKDHATKFRKTFVELSPACKQSTSRIILIHFVYFSLSVDFLGWLIQILNLVFYDMTSLLVKI